MIYRFLIFTVLALLSCNTPNTSIELEETIQFQDIAQVKAPAGMKLYDERKGRSPYQIYFSENNELELQFKHLNNFAGEMPRLKSIYDRNASKNGIEILESSFREINGHGFLIHRTEGVNDNINYYSIQLATIREERIVQCLIRTLTKNKENWEATMEAVAETIQLQ